MKVTPADTRTAEYSAHLDAQAGGPLWKRVLPVQAPYRWFLRRQNLGNVLEVGCGVGRNLAHLEGRERLGVDHNPTSVEVAVRRGLPAVTSEDFEARAAAGSLPAFDALLLSHVLEHLTPEDGVEVLQHYAKFLRDGGKVLAIVPPLAGHWLEASHLTHYDPASLPALLERAGFTVEWTRSFPFPAFASRFFKKNETISLATVRHS